MHEYITENFSIRKRALDKIPRGTLGPLVRVKDMDGRERRAVIVFWSEKNPMGGRGYFPRRGYFCIDTGDYISDL